MREPSLANASCTCREFSWGVPDDHLDAFEAGNALKRGQVDSSLDQVRDRRATQEADVPVRYSVERKWSYSRTVLKGCDRRS